jgi:mono/diheme cytochrome c family protein
MEELLAAAAEAMDSPASMVERSAAARAKADGVSVEDVLRAWSGGGEIVASAPAAAEPAPVDTPVAPVAEAAPPSTAAPMDEASIIAAAAEKMGMPESMVTRSAAARAKAQGVAVDEVLREWAGLGAGGSAPAPAAPVAAPAAAVPVAASTPPASAPAVPDVEVLGGQDEEVESTAAAAPVDALESEAEAAAAGALPRWLAALFVLIPSFALGYALFLPNGPNCGDAASLAVDPVTGLAVNCDGSEFGSELIDLFTLGSETYAGAGCVACHGPTGGGVATFPAFTGGGLLSTFPEGSCSDQLEWISLATGGWPEATYGATAKPVGGSGTMPGFAAALSAQEIAAVAIYERVSFGGQDLDAALADCGGSPENGAAALGG